MNLVEKSTPVLFVEAIEPSLPFWSALGFQRGIEVPDGERLAFVILSAGSVELMYQTVRSLQNDSANVAGLFSHDKTFLFVEVGDIDLVAGKLAAYEIVMPRRQTFYGSTEIGYREPGGHIVTFAQMPPRA